MGWNIFLLCSLHFTTPSLYIFNISKAETPNHTSINIATSPSFKCHPYRAALGHFWPSKSKNDAARTLYYIRKVTTAWYLGVRRNVGSCCVWKIIMSYNKKNEKNCNQQQQKDMLQMCWGVITCISNIGISNNANSVFDHKLWGH